MSCNICNNDYFKKYDNGPDRNENINNYRKQPIKNNYNRYIARLKCNTCRYVIHFDYSGKKIATSRF